MKLRFCRICGKKGIRFASDGCKYCGAAYVTDTQWKLAKQKGYTNGKVMKKKGYFINQNFFSSYDLTDILYYVGFISFIIIVWSLLTINPLVAITFFTIISVIILFSYLNTKK